MKRLLAATTAGVISLTAGVAGSHPHVFVGGGAHFGMNENGELERLHISWIYDTYASLYLLSYLDVDKDGDRVLTDEDKKLILADQTNWPATFAGDSYLRVDGKKIAMSKPVDADTRILEDGRVEVTFDRVLDEPIKPGQGKLAASVKLYDPTFYYAYEVSESPEIRGAGADCSARHIPYDPAAPGLASLRTELAALGRDETPEQEDVGALFADELILSCD